MRKQIFVYLTLILLVIVLLYLVLFSLQHGNTLFYWKMLHLTLFLFLFPLAFSFEWAPFPWAITLLGALFMAASFLSFWATGSLYFLIPFLPYLILSIGFFLLHRRAVGELLVSELVMEKNLKRQNELQALLEEKRIRSRAVQEKYLTFYNLRKVIEELAVHLTFEKLSQMVVLQAFELIKKGDRSLLSIGSADKTNLRIVATRSLDSEARVAYQKGDYFDFWVFKNHQPLLIGDLEKDFRFNVNQRSLEHPFESAVIAPLIFEGAESGVIRINSSKKEAFTVEDLRLLQILAELVSTAITNSLLYARTEELAIHDSLTGLYVHRYFKERLTQECERTRAVSDRSFSLILLDLDHFKKFNDTYGHASGDIILQKVGQLIRAQVGSQGLVARYGGEEFAVILPAFNRVNTAQIAETIREKVESFSIAIRDREHRIKISGGVAEFPRDGKKEEELIHVADRALYLAKGKGRNRICSAGS